MPNWTDDLVLGTSNASAGDNELRSFMTQLASGLSRSFNWPGSGGGSLASAGESLLGNARCAHTTNLAGGYGDGHLALNPAHVSLHHIGSSWQALLGHSEIVDHGLSLALPASQRWITQSGTSQLPAPSSRSFGTITVSFASVYDDTPAFVQVNIRQNSLALYNGWLCNVSSFTAGGFTSSYSGLGNTLDGASQVLLAWESQGSVTL